MYHRTKTYLAGDWDGDRNAIEQIHKWNKSDYYSLFEFVDVHEFKQARDTSLNCTIKASLHERMKMCKLFVLVVGKYTNSVRAGSCAYCKDYRNYGESISCNRYRNIDLRSYVEYECEQAIKQNLNIIVLYNSLEVNKSLCSEILRNKGIHIPMIKKDISYGLIWNYSGVRDAFNNYAK